MLRSMAKQALTALLYVHKRKKLQLLVTAIVIIGFSVVYVNYYWKQKVVTGPDVWNLNSSIIAIGGAITSKRVYGVDANNIAAKFQLFHTFLPTFCETASTSYDYRFYFAYDFNDEVFANTRLLAAFQKTFADEMRRLCDEPRNIKSSLHMVECNYTGKPAWAQNDAMLEAYLDNVDCYYRINDDTEMETGGWVDAFLAVLNQYEPPLVGVVGPTHNGKDASILTYDFVHRTHVDIFGFYYPRLFADWCGDSWITHIYRPDRSTKLSDITVHHTRELGRRYNKPHKSIFRKLYGQLKRDNSTLKRYIKAVNSNRETGVKPDGRKVISMSLYSKDPRYTWGVLRNAQLVPVYLPEWTLRVYVAAYPAPLELAVPPRIINKIRQLGAEIATVPAENSMAPRNWRLLAASDQHLDYFLVRDADARLSEREAGAVRDWVSAAEKNGPQSAVIHCIRDHPKHANQAIVDGLWGGRPRALHQRLNKSFTNIPTLASTRATSSEVNVVLKEVLWPAVADVAYCHDSVSPCERWIPAASRHPFPTSRPGQEYLGQKFDEHQQLVSEDGYQLPSSSSSTRRRRLHHRRYHKD